MAIHVRNTSQTNDTYLPQHMYYNSIQEIEALVRGFETKELPKTDWTHNAHLTVGLYYIYHHSFHEALCLMKARIITYNESVGGVNSPTSGYHETLTVFWLKVIDDFLKQRRHLPVLEACNEFHASHQANKDYPLQYYSKEKLFSVQARAVWTIPDKKPL